MKSCIHTELLEKAALDQARGRGLAPQIQSHLADCNFCNEIFQELVDQFTMTDRYFHTFPETSIVDFANRLPRVPGNGFTHIAVPVYSEPVWQTTAQYSKTLAADSSSQSRQNRYANRGVLSTKDGEIIIRIIETIDSGVVVLHLISEDPDECRNVPVKLEPSGLELLSDEQGRLSLPKKDLPDLEHLKIAVQTPRTTFSLKEMVADWEEFIGKGEIMLRNSDEEELFIEFNPEGRNYCLTVRLNKSQLINGAQKVQILANKSVHMSHINQVDKGIAVFHEITESPALRVRVFG